MVLFSATFANTNHYHQIVCQTVEVFSNRETIESNRSIDRFFVVVVYVVVVVVPLQNGDILYAIEDKTKWGENESPLDIKVSNSKTRIPLYF